MPPRPARACPHCGKLRSERQIKRHLEPYREGTGYMSDSEAESSSDNVDDADNPPQPALPVDHAPNHMDVDPPPDLVNANPHPPVDIHVPPVGVNNPLANDQHPPPDANLNGLQPLFTHIPLLENVYRILRNPHGAIDEWGNLISPDPSEADYEPEDDGSVSSNEDPLFDEQVDELRLDPDDEPRIDQALLREFLEEFLVGLDDDEWDELQARELNRRDRKTFELLATRLRTHFSRSTWDDLRLGVCAEHEIPSEFIAWRRLRILSGLDTVPYDCCINSCLCYLGRFADLEACSFCGEQRYAANHKPRRVFHYTPLIPQLRALFQNTAMVTKLRYRSEADVDRELGVTHDVFDGQDYRRLRATPIDQPGGYCFFDNPEDIALGLSTDGVTLFKRRRRGLSTAWPIILINYNLHPRHRTKLENVLCVGVIPGPLQCKDINSFLEPLLDELLKLQEGVECSGLSPEGVAYVFTLHAFLILVFGDILAVSKMTAMKGHNGVAPCRACYMQGYPCPLARTTVYYIPLRRPDNEIPHSPVELPMRSHVEFLADLRAIEAAPTRAAREFLQKDLGINSRSIFTRLKSIDLSSSFPYDIMHLLFENLVPNMIKHWTGTFKWLDAGQNGGYVIDEVVWKVIGKQTAAATRTIPAEFVGTLPNIADDTKLFKAEAFAFWFQYMAPILLRGRLNEPYYSHFLKMREIMLLVMQFKIEDEEIDFLERMVGEWVNEYELLYYQYALERLPACPLTIHALLHMAYYIRRTGPLWASWAFVMERFCQFILLAVKNRVRPYEMINNYVARSAQMKVISRTFDLPLVGRPRVQRRVVHGVEISSRERMHDEFPEVVLGVPVKTRGVHTTQLENQLLGYFSLVSPDTPRHQLKRRINFESLISYGRFRQVPDGDRIRSAKLIASDHLARDNSFVKYDLLPDRNARWRRLPYVPYVQCYYGRCVGIYFVRFIEDKGTDNAYLLAAVQQCNTDGSDAVRPETPVVTYTELGPINLVHIDTIISVVGRIQLGATWAIVDRSRDCVRPQFDDGDDSEDGDGD
ncbi:Transposase family Tnp2 protein [Ceratobasidium sp. AG-Ba]|nr:Transposase family Tnp2 protein [Ceratobasidium sp. AG-Ba]